MISVNLEKVCIGHLEVRFSLVKDQRLVNTILATEGKKDGIQSLVLLWLYVASPEEAVLLNMDGIGSSFRHGHNRVTDLLFCVSKLSQSLWQSGAQDSFQKLLLHHIPLSTRP